MKKLIYLFLTVLIVACSGEDNNNDENNNNQSSCPIYLDSNGITIKACDDTNVGDTGVVNGVTYTVVDEAMLREMAGYNGIGIVEDLTKMCTTRVTDMSELFYGCNEPFNQPIGNWDVSNVTNMRHMFYFECPLTEFNQYISQWDVSNVTSMKYMFYNAASFNQDLSSWGVDNVTQCGQFSEGATSWTQPQPNFTNCNP